MAFMHLWHFGNCFPANYIFTAVVHFMINFSVASKTDCRNSLFFSPFTFLADASAVHTEFLTSNYSEVSCIRLQSHFPISSRELY